MGPRDEAAEQAAIDAALDAFMAADPTPGAVVGLVEDGRLVHVVARGEATLGDGRPPDSGTVFRIASMTKSFTAATLMALRDEGLLSLDDPVGRWLPWLAEPAPFGVTLTLRHLLSMSGGYPTDDPWGDRQQDLPVGAFDALAASGFTSIVRPGTRFEYSNLGYALLGRVVTVAAGEPFEAVVASRVLQPLDLRSTTFGVAELPDPSRMATGYVPRGDGPRPPLDVEPVVASGAFAPMGGLLSTLDDLAVWVDGFLRAEQDGSFGQTVAAVSLREMTHQQRFIGVEVDERQGARPVATSFGYGFGLVEEQSTRHGRVVQHSGGYPGFGSHMRWHPHSGLAVIGLGNRSYSPMRNLTTRVLDSVIAGRPRQAVAKPAPRTEAAAAAMGGLLQSWDDTVASAWFADNMDRDVPRRLREEERDKAVLEVGPVRRPGSVPAQIPAQVPADDETDLPPDQARTGAHQVWWVPAERGAVRVELLMSPQRPMLVQALKLEAVVQPSELLRTTAERLLAVANTTCLGEHGTDPWVDWTHSERASGQFDRTAFEAQARWVGSHGGPLRLGWVTAGDGTTQATWGLRDSTDQDTAVAELTVRLTADEPHHLAAANLQLTPPRLP